MHVSFIQYVHREALAEAAEHSTDPDQEACPHCGLILMDPGSCPIQIFHTSAQLHVDLPSAAWNTVDNKESFRLTTEECISGLVCHWKLNLSVCIYQHFIALHRKRDDKHYGYRHVQIFLKNVTYLREVKEFMNAILCLTKVQVRTRLAVKMTRLWLKVKAKSTNTASAARVGAQQHSKLNTLLIKLEDSRLPVRFSLESIVKLWKLYWY